MILPQVPNADNPNPQFLLPHLLIDPQWFFPY
jgi:hypothetical protein